ncbi:MAG TPA: DUF2142 domain-containing protein, partial [Verrucomicrobiae bacterium]|nr:DUF2142 domain-containing protein [Verrucomicrobiae bacterium]
AGARVLVYCAAFPFFNNVDEVAHFDLVVKYSHGQPPNGFEPLSPETAQYVARYATPEYLSQARSSTSGHVPPPPWVRGPGETSADLAQKAASWQRVINPESSQAPLYYALAGCWMNLGRAFLPAGGALLYWIRFLNVPVIVALVLLAHFAARMIFPESRFMRLGVPALVAFFPQDAFYSIQNDVLSPVCFGVAFIGLVRLFRDEHLTMRAGLITGLAIAATGFVKVSNLPLLGVAAAAILFKAWQLGKANKISAAFSTLAVLALSAGLPLAGLVVWNEMRFGDATGSAGKIALLGWTRKPFTYWWVHPIFSPAGLWTFWHELIASFWRGEIVWFGQRLALKPIDYFYSISSVIVLGTGAVRAISTCVGTTDLRRSSLWLSLASFVAAVAYLAALSTAFDFGGCVYPSRAHPYFISGRLLSGVLVPFLLLYAMGLDQLFGRGKSDLPRWCALGVAVLIATISEIVLQVPVFSSQYNLFHM